MTSKNRTQLGHFPISFFFCHCRKARTNGERVWKRERQVMLSSTKHLKRIVSSHFVLRRIAEWPPHLERENSQRTDDEENVAGVTRVEIASIASRLNALRFRVRCGAASIKRCIPVLFMAAPLKHRRTYPCSVYVYLNTRPWKMGGFPDKWGGYGRRKGSDKISTKIRDRIVSIWSRGGNVRVTSGVSVDCGSCRI